MKGFDEMENEQNIQKNETAENTETQQEAKTYTQEQVDTMITQAVDDYKNSSQADIGKYQQAAINAQIQSKATVAALQSGIDVNTLPYVLKLADFSGVADKNGSISEDKLKAAIDKVLTDIPALKKAESTAGFKIGADSNNTNSQTQNDLLKKAFGL